MRELKEINASNEKIARFMGARPSPNHVPSDLYLWFDSPLFSVHLYNKKKLKYHESWDWLMPVVEKISIMASVDIRIQKSGGCTMWVDGIMISSAYNGTAIDQVYSCAVRFIDWHNEQNP